MKKLLHYLLMGMLLLPSATLFAQKDTTTEKPLYKAEQMPEYPGGDEALIKFIRENLKYPASAAQAGVEGRVTVRFVVDKKGNVTDATVIRGLNQACDDEAMRIINLMPRWKPGKQDGEKVAVYFVLPIVYKLQKSEPLLYVDGFLQPYSFMKDTAKLKPSDIKSMNVLKEAEALAKYGEKGKNGAIIIETLSRAAKIDSAIRFDVPLYGVEVMPQFPGGENALLDFVKNNLRYPTHDAEQGIQGRTTIRFIINKAGKVTNITVIKGLSPGCDAEAVRVVRLMPTWKPGTQNGQPVCVYYTLPMVYKLQR